MKVYAGGDLDVFAEPVSAAAAAETSFPTPAIDSPLDTLADSVHSEANLASGKDDISDTEGIEEEDEIYSDRNEDYFSLSFSSVLILFLFKLILLTIRIFCVLLKRLPFSIYYASRQTINNSSYYYYNL